MNIARYLDHAVLKPNMTPEEVKAAIQLGIDYKVRTVCVRGCDIDLALEMCSGTETDVSCVLDFPYGYSGAAVKRAASREYSEKGVFEIDMVMNYGYAIGGCWDKVEDEIRGVVEEAHKKNVGVKVIFETSQLNVDQIKKGVEVCIAAGADFVKTSTGFNGTGATVEAVQAMLDAAKGRIKVKPSGGIRDFKTAKMYVDMGADRLGTGYGSCKPICDGEGASAEAY
ncbi:MAG: deoxyribose-phosphate aldolase [Clostridia bacterium]|nr:deoxyribose-phosphate aldolase [Clostridia bacterium]